MIRYSLLAALLLLAACDAASPNLDHSRRAAHPVEVALNDKVPGDVFYRLSALAEGETFEAQMHLEGGSAASLVNTKTGGAVTLGLRLDRLRADSVTVDYLADGVAVAEPVTYRLAASRSDDEPLAGGSSDDEPDSYHWEVVNGELIVVEDYEGGSDVQADRVPPGAAFETVRGERVRVTHVSFTVHGVDRPRPSAVRFVSPVPFEMLRHEPARS